MSGTGRRQDEDLTTHAARDAVLSGESERSVLVTGASGALGPAVVQAFLDAGWRVRTFSASAPRPGSPASGLPHVVADINDRSVLAKELDGVEVVVHMAALLHIPNPGSELEAEYTRVNVEGTRSVVEEARRAGVRRVALLSSICVYGAQVGLVNEETPPIPDTPYARTKNQAEQIVLDARTAEGRAIGVVLRLGAVYGATIKGNYSRLVRALARGRFVPIGRGLNRRTLVYERDVAAAILLAASQERAAGRVFNVTDGSFHTVAAITESICNCLGRTPPRWSIPVKVAAAAIRIAELPFQTVRRRPPVSRETLAKYLEEVTVAGDTIREDLGFVPVWTMEKGWRETIEGMRRLGRL